MARKYKIVADIQTIEYKDGRFYVTFDCRIEEILRGMPPATRFDFNTYEIVNWPNRVSDYGRVAETAYSQLISHLELIVKGMKQRIQSKKNKEEG